MDVVLEQEIGRLGLERVARAVAKAAGTGRGWHVAVLNSLGRGETAAPGQMLDSGPQCPLLHHRGVRRTKEWTDSKDNEQGLGTEESPLGKVSRKEEDCSHSEDGCRWGGSRS